MDILQGNFEDTEISANAIVVDWARENAKDVLKSVVDEEAENWDDVNLQTWKIATYNIVKRLKDSTQMGFLVNNIKRRLTIYAGNTCLNIENRTEPVPVYSVSRSELRPSDVNNWNKAEIDDIRPKHRHQLAEDISPQQPLNTRLQAFRMLVNSQLADVASCDYWGLLRKHLVESLCDSDVEIFKLSLNIHAKLLTQSHNIMRESFSNLTEAMRSHYSRKFHKFLPSREQGLEFNNPVHYRLIKISHLVLEATKIVTQHWVRMGEKPVDEMMSAFLALLSLHTYDSLNSKNVLYPFHIMATIDPKANWCRTWLYGRFGRTMFMSQQSRVITLLRSVVEEISEYVNTRSDNEPTKPVDFVCKESVRVSVFSHSVNILCSVATYKTGHSFFPMSCRIKQDPVTLPEVLCIVIRHLNNSQELNILNYKIVSDAMVKLISAHESPFISLTEVFVACLESMKEVTDQKRGRPPHRVPWHTIDILETLSKNQTGLMFLVEGRSNVEPEMKSPWGKINCLDLLAGYHPVNIIMNYTDILLKCRKPCKKSLIPLLRICTMIFEYYDLCLESPQIPLIDSAVIRFRHLQSKNKDIFRSQMGSSNFESEKLCKSLTCFLASVVSHPGGLLSVIQRRLVLSDLIPLVFENCSPLWEPSEFRRLVLMLTIYQEVEDTMVSECTKPLSKVLHNLWSTFEDQEKFIRGIEHDINSAITHYKNIVHIFACTLSGTKIFLSEYEGSEETLLESGCNPTSPVELIMIEHSNDPWHKVALLTLQALTRNLDAWLYVESKFDIEKRLVQIQLQSVTSPIFEKASSGESEVKKNIIIDECSILRHQILTMTHIVSKSIQEEILDVSSEMLESFMFEHCSIQKTEVTKYVSNTLGGKSEFQQLLESSEVITNNTDWIVSARKVFHSMQEDVKPSVIIALAEHISQYNVHMDSALPWAIEPSSVNRDLCAEEMLGVKLSVRYGVQIGLLEEELPNDHLLKEFVQRTHNVLKIDRSPTIFRGFDWFLSSVFILCAGNLEECQSFLNHFVSLQVSLIVWPSLAESKGMHHLRIVFNSLVEIVISKSVHRASVALHATGVSWGTLCYSWLSQCFWTILKWSQVCEWLTLCLLYPPDITVYYCAALLNYLQPRILRASIDEYTWDEFVHENFIDFSIQKQMTFLDELIEEHRSSILPKLLQAIAMG